jgi:hypothetical protein
LGLCEVYLLGHFVVYINIIIFLDLGCGFGDCDVLHLWDITVWTLSVFNQD